MTYYKDYKNKVLQNPEVKSEYDALQYDYQLLEKKELNKNISKKQFIEDLDCLFFELKELYGMYNYFGNDKFMYAKAAVIKQLNGSFVFYYALNTLKKELSFIKDGHFYVGEPYENKIVFSYAIRYSSYYGIPVIDCKKFYSDFPEEEKQLAEFAHNGIHYRNNKPLILDFRDNQGGSSTYIYDFLENVLGQEIGYSYRYLQRCTNLYLNYLELNHIDWKPELHDVITEEICPKIRNNKRIYVLINEQTSSAAEEGIAVLKNIENVTIVGNHTAGRVSAGNCLSLYMPNSHLKTYFGTGLLLYEGKINIDAEGGFHGDISFEQFDHIIKSIVETQKGPLP